jgi:hypothetical protein
MRGGRGSVIPPHFMCIHAEKVCDLLKKIQDNGIATDIFIFLMRIAKRTRLTNRRRICAHDIASILIVGRLRSFPIRYTEPIIYLDISICIYGFVPSTVSRSEDDRQ